MLARVGEGSSLKALSASSSAMALCTSFTGRGGAGAWSRNWMLSSMPGSSSGISITSGVIARPLPFSWAVKRRGRSSLLVLRAVLGLANGTKASSAATGSCGGECGESGGPSSVCGSGRSGEALRGSARSRLRKRGSRRCCSSSTASTSVDVPDRVERVRARFGLEARVPSRSRRRGGRTTSASVGAACSSVQMSVERRSCSLSCSDGEPGGMGVCDGVTRLLGDRSERSSGIEVTLPGAK